MLQVSDHCGLNGRLLQLLINTWHLKLFIGVFVMFPFRKFLSKIFFFENFDFLSFCGWSGQSRTFRTVCGVFSHPDCPISTPSRWWSVGDQYMWFFFFFFCLHERSGQSTGYFHTLTVPSVHPAVGDQWVISTWEFFFFLPSRTFRTQSTGYFHTLTVPSVHPAVGDQWVNQYMRFFFFFCLHERSGHSLRGIFTPSCQYTHPWASVCESAPWNCFSSRLI